MTAIIGFFTFWILTAEAIAIFAIKTKIEGGNNWTYIRNMRKRGIFV